MWLVDELAEQHIQQAQQKGEFENLPGQGRPLQLDDDSAVPPELRVAYRLLKNAGYLPAELQDRKEALGLSDLLHSINSQDMRYAEASARLRLLEMKLRQAGLSTDFLRHDYRAQIEKRLTRPEKR